MLVIICGGDRLGEAREGDTWVATVGYLSFLFMITFFGDAATLDELTEGYIRCIIDCYY